jgi:trehalose 2-sulfotransferase
MMKPTVSYIICSTPRCGSHLLSEALQNTQVAGKPDEYFIIDQNGRLENETGNIAEQYGRMTLTEFREFVLRFGSTDNGVFGIIIAMNYLPQIAQNYQQLPDYQGLDHYQLLNRLFHNPKYIWITRQDKVRQSVSLVKALATDSWIQTKKEKDAPVKKPVFNYTALEHWRNRLDEIDQRWPAFFEANNITPYKVVYEDLVHNYEQTALEILDFLGVPRPETVAFRERRLQKQADQLNEEWVARYYAIKRYERFTIGRWLLRTNQSIYKLSVRRVVRSLLGKMRSK